MVNEGRAGRSTVVWRAVAVAAAWTVVVAGCGGGTDDASPAPTAPAEANSQSTPEPEATVSLDELTERALDDEAGATVELALAQFALDFGPVDGAPKVSFDEAAPATGTATLHDIARVWDDLDIAQQTQIAEALDREKAASTLLGSVDGADPTVPVPDGDDPFADLGDDGEVEDEEEALAPADGAPEVVLAAYSGPAGGPLTDDEVLAVARTSAVWLVGRLGGSLNFDISSAPAGEAATRTLDAVTYDTFFLPGEVIAGAATTGRCTITVYRRPYMTGDRLESVIAHEAFHCWTVLNSPNDGDYLRFPPWFHEGLATWVGEEMARGSSFGQHWSPPFFDLATFPLYRAKYRAFAFFGQVAALRGGPTALFDAIPAMVAAAPNGNSAALTEILDGLDPEQIAQVASSAAREPGWGTGWDFSSAGLTADGRRPQPRPVRTSTGNAETARPGEQTIVEFDLEPPAGSDGSWVLHLEAAGLTNNRWSSGDTFATTSPTAEDWCVGGDCVCPDGSKPAGELAPVPDGSTALVSALTGPPDAVSSIELSFSNFDDLCDDEPEPEPSGETPGGLTGTWRASNEALKGAFAQAFADLGDGFGVGAVSGDVIMTIAGDGTGTVTYTAVTLFFEDSPVDTIILDGRGDFAWSIDGEGAFTVRGTSFQMAANSPAFGELPLVIPETSALGGATSRYSISPPTGELILVQLDATATNNTFFPNVWFRQ